MYEWTTMPCIKTIILYRKGQFVISDICGCRASNRTNELIFYRLNSSVAIHIIFNSEQITNDVLDNVLSMLGDIETNKNNFLRIGEDVKEIYE